MGVPHASKRGTKSINIFVVSALLSKKKIDLLFYDHCPMPLARAMILTSERGGGGWGGGGYFFVLGRGASDMPRGGINNLQHHQFFCKKTFVWAFSGLVHVIGALFGCILHTFNSFMMLFEPVLAIVLLFSTFVPFHRCVLCILHCL